jgi:Aspartyl/Asparaginyl beta-hydroxylase
LFLLGLAAPGTRREDVPRQRGIRAMSGESRLIEQVGRVCGLDRHLLDRVGREARTVPTDWVAEYGEYQSGGWLTLSLYNKSGDPRDVTISDCVGQETSLLEQMPATRDLLRSFGLKYMWVRLAMLQPKSFLWEHRDYGELADLERHRLHIPLHTNQSAALVLGGVKVHLGYGHMWRLVPTHPHGACNLTGPARFHIIMDCYADDAFREITSDITLGDEDVIRLPEATQAELEKHVDEAVSLARFGYEGAAERALLRLFYSYSLPEGTVYDLIAEMFRRVGDGARANSWVDKKKLMLELS